MMPTTWSHPQIARRKFDFPGPVGATTIVNWRKGGLFEADQSPLFTICILSQLPLVCAWELSYPAKIRLSGKLSRDS